MQNAITVKDLSKAVTSWSYPKINTMLCLPEFVGLIIECPSRRFIKIEDVPKVCELLYRIMGAPA